MEEIYINYSTVRLVNTGYEWVREIGNEYRNPVIYTEQERRIILKCLATQSFSEEYDACFESMVYALGDISIINAYEESFGDKCNTEVLKLIKEIQKSGELGKYYKIPHSTTIDFCTGSYSILDLLEDLVEDKSQILVDSELVGRYNRVTRQVIDKSSLNSKVDYENWNRIIGITDNSTRANLGLSFIVPISVEIPENTVGVAPGKMDLTSIRTVCIIKDGKLWTPKIAVKINSKDLKEKLKGLPAFVFNVLFDNEFLLDLTRMPIINVTRIKSNPVSRFIALSNDLKIHRIKAKYYDKLLYKLRNSLSLIPDKIEKAEKSEKEKFLNSLGIYGNNYIPKTTKTVYSGTYKAPILSVSSNIINLDKDERVITEYINLGTTKNKDYKAILSQAEQGVDLSDTERAIKDLEVLSDLEKTKIDLCMREKNLYAFYTLAKKGSGFGSTKVLGKKSVTKIEKTCSETLLNYGIAVTNKVTIELKQIEA